MSWFLIWKTVDLFNMTSVLDWFKQMTYRTEHWQAIPSPGHYILQVDVGTPPDCSCQVLRFLGIEKSYLFVYIHVNIEINISIYIYGCIYIYVNVYTNPAKVGNLDHRPTGECNQDQLIHIILLSGQFTTR